MINVLSLGKDKQVSSPSDVKFSWHEATEAFMTAAENTTVPTIGTQERNVMAELNPQPLPPGKVSLEDAVEAIMRGVLRALDSRTEATTSAPGITNALASTVRPVGFPNIRVIAGGIIDPAVRNE